jgi:hypothetical protein
MGRRITLADHPRCTGVVAAMTQPVQRRPAVSAWFLAAIGLTLIAGVAEVGGQQRLRHGADHPQIEMARQAVVRLNAGALPLSVPGNDQVDLAASLDPWITVTDQHGVPLASSGTLDGLPAIPPSGVFDWVRAHGEDTISWEPAPGVRSAIAVDAYRGGFVVAGRSLRVVEQDENALLHWIAGGWLAAMAILGAAFWWRQRGAAPWKRSSANKLMS